VYPLKVLEILESTGINAHCTLGSCASGQKQGFSKESALFHTFLLIEP
jgi:hypothetical protein